MRRKDRARAMRAVLGNARANTRFRPSEVAESARSIVKHMPSIGFCSTDFVIQPVSLPRIATLHGAYGEVAA